MSLRRAVAPLAAVLVVAGSVAASPPVATAATLTGITGAVTTPDGTGLGGAVVTVRTPGGDVLATGTTTADGAYTVSGVPAGERVVCVDAAAVTTPASAAGYLVDCGNGEPTPQLGQPVRVRTDGTTVVRRTVYPATIVAGRITDRVGNPVVGATVALGYRAPTVTTGADGSYRTAVDARVLDGVLPCVDGSAGVSPTSSAGFVDACFPFRGDDHYQPIEAGRIYTFDQRLAPAAVVTGRVTDHRGNGIPGVLVMAMDAHYAVDERAVTGADGTYAVRGLPSRTQIGVLFLPQQISGPGSDLGYLAECWRDVATSYNCRPGSPSSTATLVTTPAGAVRSGIDAVLEDAGGVAGQITDSRGRPVAGTRVSENGSPDDVTDADGRFRFTHLTDPTVQICLQYDNTRTADVPFGYSDTCWTDADGGRDIPIRSGIVSTADVVLHGRGAVSGVAVDRTGRPLQGVTVQPESDEHGYLSSVTTGQDGSFQIGYLDAGDYRVCFETDDFRPIAAAPLGVVRTCRPVTVSEYTVTPLSPTALTYAGAVAGHLTDRYGFAITNVLMTATNLATGEQIQRYLDPDYSEAGLPPGQYTVCFDPGTAVREVDYRRPRTGWQDQCWRRADPGDAPTVVTVRSGAITPAIDARFAVRPAG